MVQYGTGSCEAVSNVLVSERAYEHFVDGGKKNLSMSLVGAVILIEECGHSIENIEKVGDLGASVVGWDVGYRAKFDSHDKISNR